MSLERNKYLQLFLVVLLCVVVEYLCFGRIFYCPNDMTFAFGGDALFLYFNTAYHSCYGSGVMLESMNYPFGESIFMTDAQGALSILSSTLNDWGIDTCSHAVGIVNGMMMYLLPLCAIFVYLILRRYKLNIYFAMIVSVAITMMAPQTFRIVSHYGLSYPFYIPMCIYWVLRKYDLKRWEWKDLAFIFTAAFFYLNNPYVGFAGLMFVPIITIAKAMKSNAQSFYYQFVGVTSFIIVSGYAIIKLTDPFINRIKEQSGFFMYDVTPKGLFASKYGLINKILSKLHMAPSAGFESTVNFGLIPMITGIAGISYIIYSRRRNRFDIQIIPEANYKYIFLGAGVLGLIACNGIIPTFIETFIKENLSSLLLFKATGRFIWLAYFAIAIWAAWFIHYLANKSAYGNKSIAILSIVALIWMGESFMGLKQFNNDMSKHGNMFKRATNWKKYLTKNGINPEEYQAILALPIMQGWASKLTTPVPWRSQYESTTMALAAELPLVDGMLSRISLDHAMNIIQLGSHPLIHKEVVNDFPDERPILVMDMSMKNDLLPGENYLLSRSTALTKYEFFDIYKLELDSLRSVPTIDSIKLKYNEGKYSSPIYYNGFEDENISEEYRYDKGVKLINKGKDLLVTEIPIETEQDSTQIEVSFWTLFTPDHELTPNFLVKSIDQNGEILEEIKVGSQFSRDVKDNWVRVAATLNCSNKTRSIQILSSTEKEEIIDDLLIRNVEDHVVVDKDKKETFLWNNYLVGEMILFQSNRTKE